MPYLLDTNAWVRYIRGNHPSLQMRLAAVSVGDVKLCSVVLTELYRGALRSADPVKNRAIVDAVVAPYDSIPFDDSAAEEHARIRVGLERRGMMIGHFDLMIAAIALAHNLTLVTHNTSEFSRIPGLPLDDWELP